MTFSRQLKEVLTVWRCSRWRMRRSPLWEAGGGSSLSCRRTFCSPTGQPENPLELHRRKLLQWFSHLPREETQFGGYLSPEAMQVEPLILERRPEDHTGLLGSSLHARNQLSTPVSLEQLFEPTQARDRGPGVNVVLYGAVGTGKSTVFRKLVLDWCSGKSLSHFSLLVPFSCEDLAQLAKAASLRDLVTRKYHHLKKHIFLSGEGSHAQQVLFLFNGLEKIKLDFRIGAAELCSDPNEALPPSAVVVNLLRKYLLPEASLLVTTRLSAVDCIPPKYVSHYAQICGFMDPDQQREYFASRLLPQQRGRPDADAEASRLLEQLFLSLQRESQLSAACFLPSYCWLTCATLHFLRFTDLQAPIRTLTGVYTGFLRLNFGGEVLGTGTGTSSPAQDHHRSLMLYVVQTIGKLAFDGVTHKRASFSEKELEQWIGGKIKTDEDLHQLAMFRTDVLDFFLTPCVESQKHLGENPSEQDERRFVFVVPAMQEYLAALYVVLGENKSPFEKLTQQVSVTIGKANEDLNALTTILSKFIPLRLFAFFNLLKLFPAFYAKMRDSNRGRIARTMATELFRSEDSFNSDVLDQVENSLLGVHGADPEQHRRGQPFELYPIFMGGLLHYGNRVLLQHLGCSIHSSSVSQITRVLRKYLVRELSKPQPPEEQMDLLVLLYEFQNPRLTAEVLASVRSIRVSNVRMTPLKCFILGSVLSCTPASYHLEELDLSSSLLTPDRLQFLLPAFKHTLRLNLCDNSSLLESGISVLMGALSENQSLTHLSLLHTGLRDQGAVELAEVLEQQQQRWRLHELNVAFNDLTDTGALALVNACRNHATLHTLHLYVNPISEVDISRDLSSSSSSRNITVLSSVLEGSEISENWNLILRKIQENTSSKNQERVKQQLKVFLEDLQLGRQQQRCSFLKRVHFFWVETSVHQALKKLQEDS